MFALARVPAHHFPALRAAAVGGGRLSAFANGQHENADEQRAKQQAKGEIPKANATVDCGEDADHHAKTDPHKQVFHARLIAHRPQKWLAPSPAGARPRLNVGLAWHQQPDSARVFFTQIIHKTRICKYLSKGY